MTRFDGDIPQVAQSPTGNPLVGRRQILRVAGLAVGVGLGAGIGLSGCTGSPSPGPGPSSSAVSPAPTSTPLPGTQDAADTENALAEYAAAVLHGSKKLTGQQKHLLGLIRDAHHAHVLALSSATPLAPANTASPTPTPQPSASPTATGTGSASPTASVSTDAGKAIKKLIKLEAAAAADHRRRAIADDGPTDQLQQLALLWASLTTAATCYKDALSHGLEPHAKLIATDRMSYRLPTTQTAISQALEQTYALIFGYQTAIAHLSGDQAKRAYSSLSSYRDLRDRLSALLVADNEKPPSPQPAYQLPIQPSTTGRAASLAGRMETAMLPYLGQWLATAKDRQEPLEALTATATTAQTWTGRIVVWPGWPTS